MYVWVFLALIKSGFGEDALIPLVYKNETSCLVAVGVTHREYGNKVKEAGCYKRKVE